MFKSHFAKRGAILQLEFLIKIANSNRQYIDTSYDTERIDQEDYDVWRRFNNDLIKTMQDEIIDIQNNVDY